MARAREEIQQLIDDAYRTRNYADLAALSAFAHVVSGAVPMQPEPSPTSLAQGHKTTKRVSYPQFKRDGDEKLVKVGWSKKERREYEHRAPRANVLRVAEVILGGGTRGRAISVDELLPMKDAAGGEIPTYQTYLILAWFRNFGAVTSRGKNKYELSRGLLDAAAIIGEWNKLPSTDES